jgi:hypothetical protein
MTLPAGKPDFAPHKTDGDGIAVVHSTTFIDPMVAGPGRIDVVATVAGLRHLDPSPEPALVFSHLAALCVPTVCDEVVIDLVENGHGYRIRQPAVAFGRPPMPDARLTSSSRPIAGAVLGRHTVTVVIGSPGASTTGADFTGTLACTWRDGYEPAPADASLIGLMVDHAVALIQRERLTGQVTDLAGQARTLSSSLVRDPRIASAVGTVMALHHVEEAQAMDLLVRISERTDHDLNEVAADIVNSGTLPELRPSEHAV